MRPINRIAAAILCVTLSPLAAVAAEEPAAGARAVVPASSAPQRQLPTPVRQWTVQDALQPAASGGQSSAAKGALIGAIVGGLSATAFVYWAAKSYGENEAGGFCGNCFAVWGTWGIPAGALAGAGIGYGISKARSRQYAPRAPRTFVAPVIGRRAGGVTMTVRY
jgi:hypothetical protein